MAFGLAFAIGWRSSSSTGQDPQDADEIEAYCGCQTGLSTVLCADRRKAVRQPRINGNGTANLRQKPGDRWFAQPVLGIGEAYRGLEPR